MLLCYQIPSLRLQYLSHHNATRNANQASRSVFSNNNAAETQLHPTERRTSCIKSSQDNKTGTGNSVSVIGDQLQTNGDYFILFDYLIFEITI